jgi:S-adenosyl-L-methionine hydrolase (adenosine-forming)
MADALVTLTTDFGVRSPYVAAMKGVLLSVNPQARVVDLSHSLPPQDLRYCSYFLKTALPYFPPGTLHVVVVDPGVGTERPILCIEGAGQRVLAPDNGCWTEWAALSSTPRVWRLTEKRWWRPEISATFHGRDIFAPIAGHLSCGVEPAELGPPVHTWVSFTLPMPRLSPLKWEGEVLFVDDFGNLLTNLPGNEFLERRAEVAVIQVSDSPITRFVKTYDEAARGTVVALVSSSGQLEVAQVQGNAASRMGASPGTPVVVLFNS